MATEYIRWGNEWVEVVHAEDPYGLQDQIPSAVLHWSLDSGFGSTAVDRIGDNPGTLSSDSGTAPAWVENADYLGGWALDFTRADGDMVTANAGVPSVLQTANDWSVGITIAATESSNGEDRTFFNAARSDPSYIMGIRNDQIAGGVFDGSWQDSQSFAEPTPPYQMRLLMTWDAGTSSVGLYRDTVSQTGTGTAAGSTIATAMVIGQTASGTGANAFHGIIDNLCVYDSVLTPSEIQADYDLNPFST